MDRRLKLHELLVELLGSRNVYFQPPSNLLMKYPAIRYNLRSIDKRNANNMPYRVDNSYELTYMTTDPDDPIVNKLNLLPLCRFDRWYAVDGLNHYVFTLYY